MTLPSLASIKESASKTQIQIKLLAAKLVDLIDYADKFEDTGIRFESEHIDSFLKEIEALVIERHDGYKNTAMHAIYQQLQSMTVENLKIKIDNIWNQLPDDAKSP